MPSALDNRPLTFDEFEGKVKRAAYVSATPGKYEYEKTDKDHIIEQIIRPTGLLDPPIEVRPTENQIDKVLEDVKATTAKGDRVLITSVTKK